MDVEATPLLLQRKTPPEPRSNLDTKPPANYKRKSEKLQVLKPAFPLLIPTPGKQNHLDVEPTPILHQHKTQLEPRSNLDTKPPANYKSKSGKLQVLKPAFSPLIPTPGKQNNLDVEPSPLLLQRKTPPEQRSNLDTKPASNAKGMVSKTSIPNYKDQIKPATPTHLPNPVNKKTEWTKYTLKTIMNP